jgi:hypothetical protein
VVCEQQFKAPFGFPMEIIPTIEQKRHALSKDRGAITFEYNSNVTNGESIREIKINLRIENYKIIQKTKPGNKWWSTSE